MNKTGKLVLRGSILVLLLLPLIALGHFFVFPQESRCIFIDYSAFNKEGDLYFKSNVPVATRDSIRVIIKEAFARDSLFLGGIASRPKFIFCDNDIDYARYGDGNGSPACTHTKLGAYIVLGRDGLSTDVVAHELLHAAFYEEVGFFKNQFTIPVWFKEGLAMQVDNRADFSEDSLRVYSDNYRSLPDLRKSGFFAGTNSQIIIKYATARYEVKRWYTKEKMRQFIAAINNGATFDKAYK